ncbi:hypothetical protein CAEBREN_24775 [Caenorhabditis brenneri]|uniref:Uncharacterized protein n=1 Tax=Caenorhabditis brenneri TaxID=135651 RepID=G0MWN2_CAEBE|nr:hypothetical protein CAEBREN_24775 [Caenorhabditis brenneri]
MTPEERMGAYSALFTWIVPVGPKLHEVKFYHVFSEKTFEMEIDNSNKQSFVKPISFMDQFCCCRPEFYANPIETKFSFEGLNITVWVTAEKTEFVYKLKVNDQGFKDYQDAFYKKFDAWTVNGLRIVLDKETLELWCNGEALKDVDRNFVDGGTLVTFDLNQYHYQLRTQGNESSGIFHLLYVNDEVIPLDTTLDIDTRSQNARFFLMMHRVGVD